MKDFHTWCSEMSNSIEDNSFKVITENQPDTIHNNAWVRANYEAYITTELSKLLLAGSLGTFVPFEEITNISEDSFNKVISLPEDSFNLLKEIIALQEKNKVETTNDDFIIGDC